MKRSLVAVLCLVLLILSAAPARGMDEVEIEVRPADGKNAFVPGDYLQLTINVKNNFVTPVKGLRISSNQGSAVVLSQVVPAGSTGEFNIALPVYEGNLRLTFSEADSRNSRFSLVRKLALQAEAPPDDQLRPPLPIGTKQLGSVRPDVAALFPARPLSPGSRRGLFIALALAVAGILVVGIFIPRHRSVIAALAAIALAGIAGAVILRLTSQIPRVIVTQQAVVWVPVGSRDAVRQTFLGVWSRAPEAAHNVAFSVQTNSLPLPLAYQWEDLFQHRFEILWNDDAGENVYTAVALRKGELRIFAISEVVLLKSAFAEDAAGSGAPVLLRNAATVGDEGISHSVLPAPADYARLLEWWDKNFHRPGHRYRIGTSDALPSLDVRCRRAAVEVRPTLWVFAVASPAAEN